MSFFEQDKHTNDTVKLLRQRKLYRAKGLLKMYPNKKIDIKRNEIGTSE